MGQADYTNSQLKTQENWKLSWVCMSWNVTTFKYREGFTRLNRFWRTILRLWTSWFWSKAKALDEVAANRKTFYGLRNPIQTLKTEIPNHPGAITNNFCLVNIHRMLILFHFTINMMLTVASDSLYCHGFTATLETKSISFSSLFWHMICVFFLHCPEKCFYGSHVLESPDGLAQ